MKSLSAIGSSTAPKREPPNPPGQEAVEQVGRGGQSQDDEPTDHPVHQDERRRERQADHRDEIRGGELPPLLLAPGAGSTFDLSLHHSSPAPARLMNLELLRKTAVFADLDDGELARVAEICQEQSFKSGEYIFKEGEPGNRLFIIVSGEIRISRTIPGSGEEALAILKAGACFGEMSVFDRSERSTDAIANGPATVMTISRPDFELVLDFNRDLAFKVLWSVVRMLSTRLRATNDNLRSLLAMSMF